MKSREVCRPPPLTDVAGLRRAGGRSTMARQLVEIEENFGRWEDVGIFGVRIAELTAWLASLRSKQPS